MQIAVDSAAADSDRSSNVGAVSAFGTQVMDPPIRLDQPGMLLEAPRFCRF